MKTSGSHAFVNQLLLCLIVTFGSAGAAGVGLVWLRHQNALLANSNRVLEARIAEVKRQVDDTTALVEGEQSRHVLLTRNAEWHLGLVEVSETQVTLVAADPVMQLAQKQSRGLFSDGLLPVKFRVALKD